MSIKKVADEFPVRRSDEEIRDAIGEFYDKVWYDRHQQLKQDIDNGIESVDPTIWKQAQRAALKIEEEYEPTEELGPYSDYDWGMINGKLSALRWVMGDE